MSHTCDCTSAIPSLDEPDYCAACGRIMPVTPNPFDRPERTPDNIGTSTSAAEATMRDIGRAVFGIRYPKDITPTSKRHKRLAS